MLSNLNEQQKAAVLAVEGPVMVFAGAGSGKTRTLTYRVAYMIDACNIKPYNILAITFTKKATNEMKERLIELIGPFAYDVTISTFHSLCARILRKEITHLGYARNFNILDEEEQLKVINDVLKENNIDKKKYPGRYMQRVIKFSKSFNVLPEDPYERNVYNMYEEKMQELNLLDFDDLLIKTHELFKNHEQVLEKYRNIFKYVLVDEFQDTNLIQYKIIKLLTLESKNIFVVGDDDQSIYSFRGTNYENMQLFKNDFSEYKIYYLTENYRSPQSILNGCNRLISHNVNREKKELFSQNPGSEDDVVIHQAYNEKQEVDFILDSIFSLKMQGVEYKDIAILYRNTVLLRNLELGIIQMGLPYKVFGGIPYLRRREIKDIMAYFKLMIDIDDEYSFRRVVNVPSRMLGETTISKVIELKNKYKISVFEAIDASKSILSERRFNALTEFKNLIIEFRDRLQTDNLIDLYEELLERIEYREYLKKEDDAEDRLDNIEEFKSILYQIETENEDLSRYERLEEAFDQALLNDDVKQNQKQALDGITLSTIHSVKGLEFDYVFVIGLEENVFPNVRRFAETEEIEEERRIAYVAFTRARKKLFLLSAQNRLLYGDRFVNRPSRFLLEFIGSSLEEEIFKEESKVEEVRKVKLLSEDEKPNYKPSDKVIHNKFGEGIIIAINKDIGQIFFDSSKDIKQIMLNHPALRKKEN
ncbi:MAG TPA: UvrD-helicase domain-containing protein [Acholeplasmataceae bacterium]|nr:UvrD-helicase domain-containing protein [Acholeplasmataceae bacterium]